MVIWNYKNREPHGHSGTLYLRVPRIKRETPPCQRTGELCFIRGDLCSSVTVFAAAGAVAVAFLFVVQGDPLSEGVAVDAEYNRGI